VPAEPRLGLNSGAEAPHSKVRALARPLDRMTKAVLPAAAALLILVAALTHSANGTGTPVFTDITAQAGIKFRHSNGSPQKDYLFEAKGGGAGLFDYDLDGRLDIFFANGNTLQEMLAGLTHPNALYHNNGDGTFTDVTTRAGVQGRGWAMGCAVGDVDNDGYPDLYVLCLSGNILYHNNGDGTFSDITGKAGLNDGSWSTSAGFLDYDKDGDLDLYVSHYVRLDFKSLPPRGSNNLCKYRGFPVMCGPRGLEGAPDAFYRNNGDGTFTDVTAQAGLKELRPLYGLGVAIGDCNNDGWPDIYVANDSCPSYLYVNQKNGTFQEMGLIAGVALSDDGMEQAGMGIDFGDYDNDGWLDITKTNFYEDYNNLYHNDHTGQFTDMSRASGMAPVTFPYVCWGTRFIDYDNDGWRDIFTVTGHVYPEFIGRPAGPEKYHTHRLLFRNLHDGRFSDVSSGAGALMQEKAGRGAAFGDIDNDGDVDVVVVNIDDVPSVLRNDGGNAANWLLIALKGTRTNRFGLGSRVEVTAAGLKQIAEATTASSIYSANDSRLHFGLGHATEADITVRWLGGKVQEFKKVPANKIITIDEDQGIR
jgi:enediyne biosynthesis protein E4